MDEDEPVRPKSFQPANLDPMSIEALNDYIDELQAEIERARQEIVRKQSLRGEADSLFRR